jgi:hypothetical protein
MKRFGIYGVAMALVAAVAFAGLVSVASVSANGGGHGNGHGQREGGKGKGGGGGGSGFPFDKIPGVLDAEGDGILAAAGALNLEICADEGLLLVKKEGSTVSGGTSTGEVDWLGLHVYFGFSGCADITGEKAAALVVGTGLTLHAEGIGIAFLKGTGSYTNDGAEHEITEDGEVVKIGTRLFDKKTKTPTPSTTEEPDPTDTPEPEPTATPTEVAP